MRLVGYVRVSKDEQEISFSAQEEAIQEWCLTHDAQLVQVYKEKMSSAQPLRRRPAINDALRAVQLFKADGLVVYRRDRMARNGFEARVIERALEKIPSATPPGVYSVQGNNDDTPEGRLVRRIVDLVAEYEGEIIRSRTKRVLEYKRSQGLSIGRIPFGKMLDDEKKIVDSPLEQKTIARALQLRAKKYSQQRIAEILNEEGLKARGRYNEETKWTQSMVSRLLRRENARNK